MDKKIKVHSVKQNCFVSPILLFESVCIIVIVIIALCFVNDVLSILHMKIHKQ